ncbi:MAG: class I SAM-dependent methyltransferase [Pseudomonadota bacterium]
MSLPENAYGHAKRLEFVARAVRELTPRRILDVGCGTGAQLTRPLAKAFPGISVLGVDTDARSIAWARAQAPLPNLAFDDFAALPGGGVFDLIVAAEVLEHVEDPLGFLVSLRRNLAQSGRVVLTTPNGYGPFEIMALIELGLHFSGLARPLRALKRALLDEPQANEPEMTLATSPHVNFFSMGGLVRLFAASGLKVRRYAPSTFLCGWGLDLLLRSPLVVAWNARIADRLPHWMNSDWMFVLEPAGPPSGAVRGRNAWGRWRKRLSERRWRATAAPR